MQNCMKMKNSTLPKFEISIFQKFGFEKMKILHLKIWNSISILNFGAGKLISKIWKSFSSIPLEYHFGTPKFEFSDVENP